MLACVASGSARVRRENWNESKKRNEGGGFPPLPSPSPFHFFLLPLQISRYNSTGNACYAGYIFVDTHFLGNHAYTGQHCELQILHSLMTRPEKGHCLIFFSCQSIPDNSVHFCFAQFNNKIHSTLS